MNESSRQRTGKASELQKSEIINYFYEDQVSLRIVMGITKDTKARQRIWIKLAHKLNALEGALKSTSKWCKYWNDMIILSKRRAQKAISYGETYRGGNHSERFPTDLEEKLLCMIGQEHLYKKWVETVSSLEEDKTNKSIYYEYNSDANVSNNTNTKKNIKTEIFYSDVSALDESHYIDENNTSKDNENSSMGNGFNFEYVPEAKSISENGDYFDDSNESKPLPQVHPKQQKQSSTSSSKGNYENLINDSFKDLPRAMMALSQSLVLVSESISKVAFAIDRFNKTNNKL